MTATPARIRRCNRATEFALAENPAVLAQRPDARPTGQDDAIVESFFDKTAHAQAMLNEKFAIVSRERRNEAAEAAEPLRIGTDIAIAPFVPYVRMIDAESGLDTSMMMTGIAVDANLDRNSVEATG